MTGNTNNTAMPTEHCMHVNAIHLQPLGFVQVIGLCRRRVHRCGNQWLLAVGSVDHWRWLQCLPFFEDLALEFVGLVGNEPELGDEGQVVFGVIVITQF